MRTRNRRARRGGPPRGLLAAWLAAAALSLTAVAHGQLFEPAPTRPLVAVSLLPDVEQVGPGQTFHVAVIFRVEPKWHIYWKNPGEGALAPRVKLALPEGFEAGEIRWPRPVPNKTPIGIEYCYYDLAALFVPITAPPQLEEGTVHLAADLMWAVCKEQCRMENGQVTVALRTTATPATPTPVADPVLERQRRRLPSPLKTLDGSTVQWDGAMLTIEGPAASSREVSLFPDASPGVTCGEIRSVVRDGRFQISVPVEVNTGNTLGEPPRLGGLVALGRRQDDPSYHFELSLNEERSR